MGVKLRILLVLVIPFLIAIILYNPWEKIDLGREIYSVNGTNKTRVWIPIEEYEPNLKNLLRGILEVPFELKWYEVCFENKGSTVTYANEDVDKNVTAILNFEGDFNLTIQYEKKECIVYEGGKYFTYNWAFLANMKISKAILASMPIRYIPINETHFLREISYASINPRVDSWGRAERTSLWIKIIIAYISMLGLIWLSTRVYTLVKNGI